MMRRASLAAIVAMLVVACGGPVRSVAPSDTPIPLPEVGQPFDAADILAAMRESRRPGGVPEELQTDAIAAAVAEAIRTIDGAPWTTMAVGGSCGPEQCTLDVSGSHPDAMGDDVWTFDVAPASETVTVVGTSLGSVSRDLAERADAIASESEPAVLDGLVLASVAWMQPPDDGRLLLAYRSGDEEGSCRRDVTVDLGTREVEVGAGVDC